MKVNFKLCILPAAKGGISMIKFLLKLAASFLPLAKQISSFSDALNTEIISHSTKCGRRTCIISRMASFQRLLIVALCAIILMKTTLVQSKLSCFFDEGIGGETCYTVPSYCNEECTTDGECLTQPCISCKHGTCQSVLPQCGDSCTQSSDCTGNESGCLSCHLGYCTYEEPSKKPSRKPSKKPSRKPSKKPSRKPSKKPSRKPSKKPSRKPSKKPTRKPSKKPSRKPSKKPSRKPNSSNGGVQGDPHFKTWHGDHFSYHGECDLVLLKNENFSDGLGILIHVRTKIENTWSYVKNAAMKIGDDILEIEGKGKVWDKSADAVHYINGEAKAELPFLFAAKFPVTRLKEKQCDTNGAKCIQAIVYKIELGEGDNILITQKWGVIKVSVTANDKDKFQGTIGIMGHFNKSGFLARDGIHKITDFNQFGQEWQVLKSEPILFIERRAPQHPELCTLPTVATKRRLGEDSSLHQMAELACAGVEEASREFCIFDVTSARTEEAASTYYTAYLE